MERKIKLTKMNMVCGFGPPAVACQGQPMNGLGKFKRTDLPMERERHPKRDAIPTHGKKGLAAPSISIGRRGADAGPCSATMLHVKNKNALQFNFPFANPTPRHFLFLAPRPPSFARPSKRTLSLECCLALFISLVLAAGRLALRALFS